MSSVFRRGTGTGGRCVADSAEVEPAQDEPQEPAQPEQAEPAEETPAEEPANNDFEIDPQDSPFLGLSPSIN